MFQIPHALHFSLPHTLFSLFWSMFGLVPADSVEIKYPEKSKGTLFAYSFPGGDHATSIVEAVGMFLMAAYHVTVIIVLINMLIAMMSHSFEDIQVSDLEMNDGMAECFLSRAIVMWSGSLQELVCG
jgi:hypothetical protein